MRRHGGGRAERLGPAQEMGLLGADHAGNAAQEIARQRGAGADATDEEKGRAAPAAGQPASRDAARAGARDARAAAPDAVAPGQRFQKPPGEIGIGVIGHGMAIDRARARPPPGRRCRRR
jgi:dihydroxyacetone kinase